MNIEFLAPWEKANIRKKIEELEQKLSQNKTNSLLMWQISDYYFQIEEYKLGLEYLKKAKDQDDIDFPQYKKNRELLHERVIREHLALKKTQL